MAVSSYSNLFGSNGAGQQGSRAGISTLFGQPSFRQMAGTEDNDEERRRQSAGAAPQTFAQMQRAGRARPAPPGGATPPMLRQLQQQLPGGGAGGVEQLQAAPGSFITEYAGGYAPGETTAASTGMGEMLPAPTYTPQAHKPRTPMAAPGAGMTGLSLAEQLQQQLTTFLQPGGYTDPEMEQLRKTQRETLQAEYGAEQKALNEELARRGLSASTIGGGRMGDLAGQQARALATMEANLAAEQAKLRQQGRETALATMSDLTRTMMQNEQQQAETRLKEQLGMSELGGVLYKRGPDGSLVPMTDADNQQIKTLAAQEVARKYGIAEAEVTGMFGGKETLAARTQRQNLAIQLAQVLAGSTDPDVLKSIMPYIYQAFGIAPPPPGPTTPPGTPAGPVTPAAPVTPVTPVTPRAPVAPGAPGGGGVTNVPMPTGPKPGVPPKPMEEIPPIGDTGKGAPKKKPFLGPLVPAPTTTPAPEFTPSPKPSLPTTGGTQPVSTPVIPVPDMPPPVLYGGGDVGEPAPEPTYAPPYVPPVEPPVESPLAPMFTPKVPTQPDYSPTYIPPAPKVPEPEYIPEPVYTPYTPYTPGPTYTPEPVYTPTYTPTYTPEPEYIPEPVYTPEPTYPPYVPYVPEPTYTPEPVPTSEPTAADEDLLRRLAEMLPTTEPMPVPETTAPVTAPGSTYTSSLDEQLRELLALQGYGEASPYDYFSADY